MSNEVEAPGIMGVYGSKISYYTGKLEAYLRYREIPYESFPTVAHSKKLIDGVGIVQMPVVQLADGRWMTDTTPMLAWLESERSGGGIFPTDPLVKFVALLIEDYADEWLWRSAMHYRWSYRLSRQYAAQFLYAELVRGTLPLPRLLAINMLKRRQYFGFVRGDGVRSNTRAHADQTYLTALKLLEQIFTRRPFLLGNSPTIADFGMMAPMFRHFSQDPTPAEIMRECAPAVYEWVARMWNLPPSSSNVDLIDSIDEVLVELLREICETHLVQLRQNAEAYGRESKRYDLTVQNYCYRSVPTSRYRVWCLETLQYQWSALNETTQEQLRDLLTADAAVIWGERVGKASEYDPERRAPFNRAINVFANGVP
ncbi:MAG: glutathione S-transferase C-terminal domain-containing protein [Pseudomonadota bacterium]